MRRGNLWSLDYLWWHLWRRCQALARDGRLEAFVDDRGRPRVEGGGGGDGKQEGGRGERDIHVIGGWLVPRSLYKTMGIFNRTEGPFRRVSNLSHCPLVHFLSCPSPLSISGNSAPQPHPAAYPLPVSLPTGQRFLPLRPPPNRLPRHSALERLPTQRLCTSCSFPLLLDRRSTTGVRKAWNAVTTRDSSSSYRQLNEHTNNIELQ